jgi:adenine deaminase
VKTVFVNGRIVNVYSGEILKQDVVVSEERIVYVGPLGRIPDPGIRVIDLQGDFLIPGFFDAHAHADLFYNPCSYANEVAPRGTTAFFNDGHDLANTLGATRYLKMMAKIADSFLNIYAGVPATSPPYPGVEGEELWSEEDLHRALTFENVISLSETTPYLRIVRGDATLRKKFDLAARKGRLVEGHTTSASLEKLNALAYAGVTSCHESLSTQDVLTRVRLGYYVMLRHGSIRRDLPHLADAVKNLEAFDTSRIMLVSDGIFPDHLIAWGNMDWIVSEAIACGIGPVRALQMVTINPARYFRLDHVLGGIAPGRLANVLVVTSLERPSPRLVMAKGKIVAEAGELSVPGLAVPKPELGDRPFRLGNVDSEMFKMPYRSGFSRIPIIKIINQTVTEKQEDTVPVKDGFYWPQGETLFVCLMSRDGTKIGKGFVRGFCDGLGGLASSVAHETHGLLVLGQRAEDMACAAKDVLAMGGGVSTVQNGEVKARIPLAIGGICSTESVGTLAGEIEAFHRVLKTEGCRLEYPLWTLGFLSFTSILRVRITYNGVYDVKLGEIIFA